MTFSFLRVIHINCCLHYDGAVGREQALPYNIAIGCMCKQPFIFSI